MGTTLAWSGGCKEKFRSSGMEIVTDLYLSQVFKSVPSLRKWVILHPSLIRLSQVLATFKASCRLCTVVLLKTGLVLGEHQECDQVCLNRTVVCLFHSQIFLLFEGPGLHLSRVVSTSLT